MSFDPKILSNVVAICRYLYKNPNVHKNTLRNDIVREGKKKDIHITKENVSRALESLIALEKILVENDHIRLSQDFIKTGVLQKKGDSFYLISPGSDKHIKINKSIAQGYEVDDVLDYMIERQGKEQRIVVLGRNKSPLVQSVINPSPSQTKVKPKTALKKPVIEENQSLEEVANEMFNELSPSQNTANRILGRVVRVNEQIMFIPNDKFMSAKFIPLLHFDKDLPKFENRICVINLLDEKAPLLGGRIVEVYGDAGNPIHEYEAIAQEIGAVVNWNIPKLKAEIDALPSEIDLSPYTLISEEEAISNHRGKLADLRNIPFCPTDPPGAKDKDDAIYSTYDEDGNLVVYTAVANLTKFIKPDSELYKVYEALGMTLYTPTRAYPITPTELSSGICALKAGEDRFAFVVKTVHNRETGEVISQNFFDAVINCKKEYTYEDAQNTVDSYKDDDLRTHFEWKELTGQSLSYDEQVLMDFYTAQELKLGFTRRNRPDFNSNHEYRPKFSDDQKKIVDIEQVPHLAYNEVIEYFMLTANEATARHAMKNNINVIYRVHDAPSPRKIEGAHEFFDVLGINFDGNVSADGLTDLINVVKGTPAEDSVKQFLIKMQSRAKYSLHPYNQTEEKKAVQKIGGEDIIKLISHFALQSAGYCHTTAPIRRTPDYPTIYNILADIHGTEPMSVDKLQTIVDIANERQIVIDEAEREIANVNSVLYAIDHIGEQMKGSVIRLRYTDPEEGYADEIVAIVKNADKGIVAEIPISQITGRKSNNYKLSPHGNYVLDAQDNVVCKICQALEFTISGADKLTLNVVGRTNKSLVQDVKSSAQNANANVSHLTKTGKNGQRKKAYEPNKSKSSKTKHHQGPKTQRKPKSSGFQKIDWEECFENGYGLGEEE